MTVIDEPLTASEQRRAEFIKTTYALAQCALEDSPDFHAKTRRLLRHASLDFAAICRDED